jgi:hypothetical protein
MTVPVRPAADDPLSESISETAQRLAAEFGGQFSREDIEEAALRSLASYQHASVLDFVPLFVERYTRETLRAAIGRTRA